MAFLFSKLFWLVLNPANLLGLLVVVATLAALLGWRRMSTGILVLLVLFCGALTLTPLPDAALSALENRFPRPDLTKFQKVDGIIILGGGVDTQRSRIFDTLSLTDAAERLLALVELERRYPEAKFVVSGGSAEFDQEGAAREADLIRDKFLPLVKIDPARVIFERNSRNTDENVRYSRALAAPQSGETWLLVTSAFHMPRAVGIFRQQNWPVIPYPVDYGSIPQQRITYDLLAGMQNFYWASHEWIGLFYYWTMGRTHQLFPGPG